MPTFIFALCVSISRSTLSPPPLPPLSPPQAGTTFPREAKFGLKIAVYDDDSAPGSPAKDLIDFFQFDGAHIPLAQDERSAQFITVFPQSIISDYTQYTQLRLRIRVSQDSGCDPRLF